MRKFPFLGNLNPLKPSFKIFLIRKNVAKNIFILFLNVKSVFLKVTPETIIVIPTLINNRFTIRVFQPTSRESKWSNSMVNKAIKIVPFSINNDGRVVRIRSCMLDTEASRNLSHHFGFARALSRRIMVLAIPHNGSW